MIYITGDTHGEVSRFTDFLDKYQPMLNDFLIVAGDFGCIFGLGVLDEDKLDLIEKLPYTVLFIDGNHECFPRINSYPEERWNGGKVHRVRRNILHLMRGQIFEIEGVRVFTMGGGYSIDKIYRTTGRSWWPEELPCEAEYQEAIRNLARYDYQVDAIISHAAPESAMCYLEIIGIIHRRYPQEQRLNDFLESVRRKVQYKQFYFGHLHMDYRFEYQMQALYHDVYCLNTGEKINPKETETRL